MSSPAAHRRRRPDEEGGENTWWVVQLTEGRTRQIREMFLRIGHPVQKLRRVAIGPLRDADLPLGALRELSEREVANLLRSAKEPKKPAKKATAKKTAAKAVPAKSAKKAPAKTAAKKPAAKKPARKTAAPPRKRGRE